MVASQLDQPLASMDEDEQRFVTGIKDHGWFASHVGAEGDLPGFAYTTGFYVTLGTPEVVIYGLPLETGHAILGSIYDIFEAHGAIDVNTPIGDILEGNDVVFKNVAKHHYDEHFGWSKWFYRGDGFEVLQMHWPDREGRFVWDEGVEASYTALQPDLSA